FLIPAFIPVLYQSFLHYFCTIRYSLVELSVKKMIDNLYSKNVKQALIDISNCYVSKWITINYYCK
ncbi:hypothetical protein, partial [Breznakia sp. PM6-1]|uniref:hypothetical protein n=1 Tax=Breznakia sp. PM6-1 TaxID=2940628 RepID=UPI002406F9FA